MLKEFPAKTKYFFNIVLPVALLLQGTLPTIEKKENLQTNFSELILKNATIQNIPTLHYLSEKHQMIQKYMLIQI
jgi:hypothetical protein